MTNFNALMENKDMNVLVPEIVWESFNEMIDLLDEEGLKKVQEYSDLLADKKVKKGLEQEISEALAPLLEKNTILYGQFLYETQAIEESCCEDSKDKLSQIREVLGRKYISEAANTNRQTPRRSGLRRAGRVAAGLGAGAAGTGAALYGIGRLSGGDAEGVVDTMRQGAGAVADTARSAGRAIKGRLTRGGGSSGTTTTPEPDLGQW